MDMLSQLEVDMLKRTASSDLYQLFRNCSLAVLNSGSLTDNSKELLSRFENFEINVLRRERGVKLESLPLSSLGTAKRVVIDKEMNEPLMGASVRIAGTRIGTTADINGNFHLRGLKKGTYTLEVSYVSFFPQKLTLQVPAKGDVAVKVEMSTDDKQLNEVTVTARKNLELERALLAERQNAVLSIENLGASEMSIKGISNVQEGVKKLTGISIAEAGQLIVRGLGDRYSSTTLNGLPIASPNPDNKPQIRN
mgnify:CR=1 FL=1